MAKAKKLLKKPAVKKSAVKKTAVKKEVKKAAPPAKKTVKTAAKKSAAKAASKSLAALSYEELVSANLTGLTRTVGNLGETMDILVQKMESMAHHIIAIEAILGDVISSEGLNLTNVNDKIREKIDSGTDGLGVADKSLKVAAEIISTKKEK